MVLDVWQPYLISRRTNSVTGAFSLISRHLVNHTFFLYAVCSTKTPAPHYNKLLMCYFAFNGFWDKDNDKLKSVHFMHLMFAVLLAFVFSFHFDEGILSRGVMLTWFLFVWMMPMSLNFHISDGGDHTSWCEELFSYAFMVMQFYFYLAVIANIKKDHLKSKTNLS